jgi:uncharacterized protein YbjT (DUF2867 family)
MHILLAGGSGFIGSRLCADLLSNGHEVRVLSRDPHHADLPEGTEAVMGDVTAPDSLAPAVENVDIVYNLVALSPLFTPEGGDKMHDIVHREGTQNLVDAAETANVAQFVQISALGADPQGPTSYIRAKGRAEEIVRTSTLTHTIFRPSVVFGSGGEFIRFTKLLAPPFLSALPGGGKTRFQPIWVGDLVPMLSAAIQVDAHGNQTYEVGGPEKLTLAEIAKKLHAANGRPTTVIPIPMGIAKVGLSIGEQIPGFPLGLDQYRSLQFDNVTTDSDITAFNLTQADLRRIETHLNRDH